jgi:PAS domain S-box-containing protein
LEKRVKELEKQVQLRKNAENALRESEEFAFSLLNNSPNPIVVINPDTSLKYVNPALMKLTGFSSSELSNSKPPYPWWTEETLQKTSRDLKKAVRKGAQEVEELFQKKNGEQFWVAITSVPVRKNRKLIYYLANWVDITDRKRTEETIRQREQEFRLIAQNVPGLFSYVAADGCYRFVNKRYEEWFALPVRRVVGKHLRQVLGKKVYELIKNHVEATLSGRQVRFEAALPYKHGGRRWVVADYVPDIDDKGRTNGFFALINDVSALKRTEEALQESEKKYKTLVDNSLTGIFIHQDGKYVFVNDKFAEMHGYEPQELIGKGPLGLVHPDDREFAKRLLSGRLKGESVSQRYEIRRLRKDGETIWGEMMATLIEYQGRPAVMGNIIDITERKGAEDAFRESEERYRGLFENSTDFVYTLDLQGNFTNVNKAAERLTGYTKTELIGMNNKHYTPIETHKRIYEAFNRLFRTGEPLQDFPLEVIVKDGSTKYFETSSTLLKQGDEIIGFQGISRDITERKQAEEALHKSEALLKEAQRVAHIGHWELAPDIGTPVWSEEIFHIFGLDPQEGEPSFTDHETYVHPEDWPVLDKAARKAGAEGTPFDLVFRIRKPGGETGWMHAIGTTSVDDEGNVTRLFGTAQDVTALWQAEDALRKSEEKYRNLIESLQEGVWVIDEHDNTTFVNVPMADMLGYTVEEMAGRPLLSFVDDETIKIARKLLERRRQGIGEQHEFVFRRRDGSSVFTIVETVPLIGRDGNYTGAIAGIIDITDRKRAEEALQKSESKYRDLVEHVNDVIYAADDKGIITYISPVVESVFGYSPPEVIGRAFKEFIYEKDLPMLRKRFQELLSGAIGPGEYRIITKSNEIRWVRSSSQPIFDQNRAIGVRGMLTDVTDRKKAEEELRKSQRQLRDLSTHLESAREQERTSIAREIHDDVGQGMTALKMDLTWLQKRLREDQGALFEKMTSMVRLIDATIQSVKRISSELRPGVLDDLGLTAAMEWMASGFQERTGITCELNFRPEEIVLGESLSTAIFRVFQESLTNAGRHANATRVKVALVQEAGTLTLTVRDNGRGITPEQISDSQSFGLIGMRERAYQFGGKLRIKGYRRKGTEVTLRIPIKESEQVEREK